MTEQGGEQGQEKSFSLKRLRGFGEAAQKRAIGVSKRVGEAWSTRPGGGGNLVEQDFPPLLTHERILLGATSRLNGILNDAETQAAALTSDSLQKVAKRSLTGTRLAVETKKKDLGKWQAYCENEQRGIETKIDYSGMLARRNELAREVNRYGKIESDKNVVRDERLAARVRALELIDEAKKLDGQLDELQTKYKERHSNDGDVLAKLEEAQEIKDGKKKPLKRPANNMAGIVYDAEQELIEHILNEGLKTELEAAVEQERNAPPPLPQSVEARQVRPVQAASVADQHEHTSLSGDTFQRPAVERTVARPVTPLAGSQERRATPPVPVRRPAPESWEDSLNIPPFKPSRHEGAAEYAVSQLLAGVRSVTVENPGIPVLLREAKVVLARMSAGMFTSNDASVIMHNRIFGDPRFSDELRSDLVKAWAQGTEVFGKNRLTKALGRVMYLMGSIGSIQTPDIFETNRFLRPIRRLMDSLNNNGISPDHILYTNELGEDSSAPEQVSARPQGRETAATVATVANVATALGKYNLGKQLSQTEIAALDGVNFQWPKGRPGAQPAGARIQTPASPARSAVPAAPSRTRAEAVPPISSAVATVTEGSIYRDAYGTGKLTEQQFAYIQANREMLDDPKVNSAYTRALRERQRRGT